MFAFIFFVLSLPCAFAGRPLITDDAGVVPHKNLQIETWAFVDERSAQYWIVPTVGIKDTLEFSIAAVQGTPLKGDTVYTYSGPILQSKVLLHKGKEHEPSFAVSGGGIAPYGQGEFQTQKWDYFYYAAMTYDPPFPKNLLLQFNFGQQSRRTSDRSGHIFLWGFATEIKIQEKTHVFAEASNGDVYAIIPGIALQTGFRHDLTEKFQLDGTIGRGVSGDPILPIWITVGIRLLFDL